MAFYDYICNYCGHHFEKEMSMKDDPLTKCPRCEQMTKSRLINLPHIIFKGDDWPGKEIAKND